MDTNTDNPRDAWRGIFALACKLHGLSDLLKAASNELIATADGAYGLGLVLSEVADELSSIHKRLDEPST